MPGRSRRNVALGIAAVMAVGATARSEAAEPVSPEPSTDITDETLSELPLGVAPESRPPAAYDLSELRSTLIRSYPEEFGGLYTAPDGATVIQLTSDSDQLRIEAEAFLGTPFDGSLYAPYGSLELPPMRFEAGVRNSLTQLFNAKHAVMSSRAELRERGVDIVMAGIDDSNNAVAIGVNQPVTDEVLRFSTSHSDQISFA